MDRDRPVKQAWRQSREPTWPVDHVEICQTPISPKYAQTTSIPVGVRKPRVRFFSDRLPDVIRTSRLQCDQPCEFTVLGNDSGDRQTVSVFDQRITPLTGMISASSNCGGRCPIDPCRAPIFCSWGSGVAHSGLDSSTERIATCLDSEARRLAGLPSLVHASGPGDRGSLRLPG